MQELMPQGNTPLESIELTPKLDHRSDMSLQTDHECQNIVMSIPKERSMPPDYSFSCFLQLETNIKSLLQAYHNDKSVCIEGAIIEQLAQSRQLFTIETLCCPDFLNLVFTRFAEYFVSVEYISVRRAIVRIFKQFGHQHLHRVSDAKQMTEGLVDLLLRSLKDESELRCDEKMIFIVAEIVKAVAFHLATNESIHLMFLRECHKHSYWKRDAIADVLNATAYHSSLTQQWIFEHAISKSDDESHRSIKHRLIQFLPHLNCHQLETIWNDFLRYLANVQKESDVIRTIKIIRDLAVSCTQPSLLHMRKDFVLSMHKLVQQDPRIRVQKAALLSILDLCGLVHITTDIYEAVTLIVRSIWAPSTAISKKVWSIRAIRELSGCDVLVMNDEMDAIMHLIEASLPELRATQGAAVMYVQILYNFAYQQTCRILSSNQSKSQSQLHDRRLSPYFLKLLKMLQVNNSEETSFNRVVWSEALYKVGVLCERFGSELVSTAVHVLIDLLEQLLHMNSGNKAISMNDATVMITAIIVLLSHLAVIAKGMIQPHRMIFLSEFRTLQRSKADTDSTLRYYLALAVILLRVTPDPVISDWDSALEEMIAIAIKHGTRIFQYRLMQEAIISGSFVSAAALLRPLLESVQHEESIGFLSMLVAMCEAELSLRNVPEIVGSETAVAAVTLGTSTKFATASAMIEAAGGSSHKFQFQKRFLDLRLQFLQNVQQLQQLLGEFAFDSLSKREHDLINVSNGFEVVGDRFYALRSALLGIGEKDLDALAAHGRCCYLICKIVDVTLIPEFPEMYRPRSPLRITAQSSNTTHSHPLYWACIRLEKAVDDAQSKQEKMAGESVLQSGVQHVQEFLQGFLKYMPSAVPRIFFRTQIRKSQLIQGSAHILTESEFTSIPKSLIRSACRVKLGSAFVGVLYGAIMIGEEFYRSLARKKLRKLKVTVLLHRGSTHAAIFSANAAIMPLVCKEIDLENGCWDSSQRPQPKTSASTTSSWIESRSKTFETNVFIDEKMLPAQGSYLISAKYDIIDTNMETWKVPMMTCSRSLIVY